jgi:hypothetical protein
MDTSDVNSVKGKGNFKLKNKGPPPFPQPSAQ